MAGSSNDSLNGSVENEIFDIWEAELQLLIWGRVASIFFNCCFYY
jgi:hypothetical protein